MPTAVRRLRDELRALSGALRRMQEDEGVARWAFVALLHDRTKISKRTIERVLVGAESLVEEAFDAE